MYDYSRIVNRVDKKTGPSDIAIKRQQISKDGNSFEQILKQKVDERALKISRHAKMRMDTRDIKLDSSDMKRLNDAVDKAEKKGVRESLVLMDDKAFVVSIKNRTVITAIDGPSIKQNVFTNIDGAVIL
ncbi:MAG TPA: flagellar protein [Thermoanaerobacterales bacterium]|jgi:flagellar operon protein|nr:flagellar protein [Thermoanaerobacterales bacterium]